MKTSFGAAMVGVSAPRFEELEPGLAEKLNANQATFADNQNVETALTQLNDLYQKGYFGENTLSETYADTNAQMARPRTIVPLP